MRMSDIEQSDLIRLRKWLHEHAEPSGHEKETARHLRRFLQATRPGLVLPELGGGSGFACVFSGEQPGPTLVFRAELDAVPIRESGDLEYGSRHPGFSHKCGHDGHMAILAGLARQLSRRPIHRGRVVLVFQSAEETGAGAKEVISDPRFQDLDPAWVFALHNLPGYPLGRILVRPGVFACASKGMMIRLTGATSHAAYPEEAISPTRALAAILQKIQELPGPLPGLNLITVVYARLGEIAFGTTPGEAELMATLRSDRNDHLEQLSRASEELVLRTAGGDGLKTAISWRDVFSTTINDSDAVKRIEHAAEQCGLPLVRTAQPFRWSEDFGEFLQRYPGAMFCIGAGEDRAPLHHPEYDFPDALITAGICMFESLIEPLLR
jgi:amidohydrolase